MSRQGPNQNKLNHGIKGQFIVEHNQNQNQNVNDVIKDIRGKIEIEQNIIQGYQDVKKSSQNTEVIQKCKSKIIESQTLIDYYQESINKLIRQSQKSKNKINTNSSDDRSSVISEYKPNYSRFDLIKYECPSLGHKIQHMIQQLQFKLQVENQYKEANQKISHLYLLDGDKSSSNAAEGGKAESDQRIQLLEKALKKYQNFNINSEDFNRDYEMMDTPKHTRKPLSGKLSIGITCVRDVDHIATAGFKKRETIITIKIDDVEKARTKPSKNDNWNEELIINVDKSHEIEISVMDKQGSNFAPIAVNWLSLFDLAEEIRKKKVAKDQGASGWLPASNLPQTNGNNGNTGYGGVNDASNLSLSYQQQNNISPSKSPSKHDTNGNEDPNDNQKVSVNTWISLEPCGQMLINLNFEKSISQGKQFRGPLGRHGAIRQRKEEVFEQQGHQFVQKQFYNIMCCALCGEFLRYTGFQCQDCKFLCHKKCYQKVVTKCISKSGADYDAAQLKHRIPHRFEAITNHGTKWCCHCGYLLPWGKKNARKCSECGVMCHAHCTHLVPDLCGMSLQMANEILATIKSTKVSPKKPKQIAQETGYASQEPKYYRQQESEKTLPPKPPVHRYPETESTQSSKDLSDDEIEKEYDSRLPTTTQKSYQQPIIDSPYDPNARTNRRRPPFEEQPSLAQFRTASHPRVQPPQLQQQHQDQQQQRKPYDTNGREAKHAQIGIPDISISKDEFNNFDYHNHNTEHQIISQEESKEFVSPFIDQPQILKQQELQQQDVIPELQQQVDQIQIETKPNHQKTHSVGTTSTTNGSSNNNKVTKQKRRRRKVGLDDFQFLAVLGKGNFGKVMLAESRHTSKLCAIKVLKKDFIVENDESESVKSEKRVFLTANKQMHPFLLNLHCCFQTENRIYFVMEYISGGDLMWHIQKNRFSAKRAKFYACEVLLGLKYFHDNGIIYRDLKLDNILLTTKGHIKIGDYGLCKENMWFENKTSTFCGTPEFMAPEIVAGKHYDRSVDWWAFGVLLFQMLLCQSPFKGDDEDDIFNAIEHDEVKYPISLSRTTVLILQALLTKDPSQRLGSSKRDAEEIMEHLYFQDINFDDVLNCRIQPPYIPELSSEHDYSNFDQEFTSETPRLTPVETVLTSEMQEQFRGFSHISEGAMV
ncbi:PKC1 [Candida pseudojiufengensis]|uniref:PKC1 n=1 Tax=Candida pseudojiufengensis TaxID=497109 RepID=UPI0022243AC9|nr:PKC1 [Candida pseudojiufengensis]KAI5966892.1 PKC1 [Candida pseudojiufengensis]